MIVWVQSACQCVGVVDPGGHVAARELGVAAAAQRQRIGGKQLAWESLQIQNLKYGFH